MNVEFVINLILINQINNLFIVNLKRYQSFYSDFEISSEKSTGDIIFFSQRTFIYLIL
jgi:hypothetical protein